MYIYFSLLFGVSCGSYVDLSPPHPYLPPSRPLLGPPRPCWTKQFSAYHPFFIFIVLRTILFLFLIITVFLNILNYIQHVNFLLNYVIPFKLFKLPWNKVSFQSFIYYFVISSLFLLQIIGIYINFFIKFLFSFTKKLYLCG